jgi:hypothetical protein
MRVKILFSPIKMQLSSEEYTYLLKTLDLNIMFSDDLCEFYDFTSVKTIKTNEKLSKDSEYHRIEIGIQLPLASIALIFKGEYLAELVF